MKTRQILVVLVTVTVLASLLMTLSQAQACNTNSKDKHSPKPTCPELPTSSVTMSVVYNQVSSYFMITLSNVPKGYDVSNGPYKGWCAEIDTTMTLNTSLKVTMSSSLDPPHALDDIEWNKVNYILNNREGFDEYVVQLALWHFLCGVSIDQIDTVNYPGVLTLINNANAHPDFTPADGQIVAVILSPACAHSKLSIQLSLIEVTYHECAHHECWQQNKDVYCDRDGRHRECDD